MKHTEIFTEDEEGKLWQGVIGPSTPQVVKKLSEPLVGGNYHLHFGNFFSSPQLYLGLLDDKLYACSTCRCTCNRKGIPQDIKDMYV